MKFGLLKRVILSYSVKGGVSMARNTSLRIRSVRVVKFYHSSLIIPFCLPLLHSLLSSPISGVYILGIRREPSAILSVFYPGESSTVSPRGGRWHKGVDKREREMKSCWSVKGTGLEKRARWRTRAGYG